MSTETEFFQKRPVLKFVVELVLKRLETVLTNALTAAIVIIYMKHSGKQETHDQIWREVGPHIEAVVKHEQNLELTDYGTVLDDSNAEKQLKEKAIKK